jgi:hypothetical protein
VIAFSEADSIPKDEDNPAASAIRALLQEHALIYKVTVRDEGGFVMREIRRPGPSVLITTAVRRLSAQMDSRLFSLTVPDDPAQVRKALDKQGDIEIDGLPEPDPALITFQSFLQARAPWPVVVPFAKRLSQEIGRSLAAPQIMRDYARLLSFIKAVTVLRHARRATDPQGRWVATLGDYATVRDLVEDMYAESVADASKGVRDLVEAVGVLDAEQVEQVAKARRAAAATGGLGLLDWQAAAGLGRGVTHATLIEHLKLSKATITRRVATALRHEWLQNLEERPGPGRPDRLVLGSVTPEPVGLPRPEALTDTPPFIGRPLNLGG